MAGLLGLPDISTGDNLGDLGLIGGLLSARVGSNWPQMLQQAAQMRMLQQRQALTDQLTRQQIESGGLDLKTKKQDVADQESFRGLQAGAPAPTGDPYKDALARYQYYQGKVPEKYLKPYVEQIEKLKPKYHTVGEALVPEPGTGTDQVKPAYEAPPKMTVAPSGAVYDPRKLTPGSTLTGPESDVIPDGKGGFMPNPAKLALRRAGATNVSVQTGEKPFVADFGKQQSGQFFKMRDAATKAATSLQSVNNMRETMAAGAYQGGGAGARATIVNYLKPLGFQVDDAKLANTQAFNSAAGQFLLQHAKELGSNPSNADAQRIKEIIGSADTDPGAMSKLLDWQEQQYRKTIRNYNGVYEQVKKNPAVFNAWDMTVPEPAPYAGGASGALNTPTLRFDKFGRAVP